MYFENSDKPENTDVCKKKGVVHEFVLFETQPSAPCWIFIEMLHVAIVVPFVYHCDKIKIFPFR